MIDYTSLTDLLLFGLPGGFFGSAVTWVISRRKRNNDFLTEMQRSIDLLSEKYNAVLQENITLRREKADWLVMQRELLLKVDHLAREVESLRRNINKKQKDHAQKCKNEQPLDSRAATADEFVRSDTEHAESHAASRKPRLRIRCAERQSKSDNSADNGTGEQIGKSLCDDGADSGSSGTGDGSHSGIA